MLTGAVPRKTMCGKKGCLLKSAGIRRKSRLGDLVKGRKVAIVVGEL
jgi:hypothetical protein